MSKLSKAEQKVKRAIEANFAVIKDPSFAGIAVDPELEDHPQDANAAFLSLCGHLATQNALGLSKQEIYMAKRRLASRKGVGRLNVKKRLVTNYLKHNYTKFGFDENIA